MLLTGINNLFNGMLRNKKNSSLLHTSNANVIVTILKYKCRVKIDDCQARVIKSLSYVSTSKIDVRVR